MGKFEQPDSSTNSQNNGNTWSTLHDDAYSFAQFKNDKNRHQEDLKRYDKNGNGKLDDRELDHALKNADSLSDIFRYSTLKQYDKNRDGVIDGKEQKKIDEDIEKANKETLKKYDTNRDGKIDKKEREKQLDDLFKDKRPPVSDKEFKEQVAESIHDLRNAIERQNPRDIVRDIQRAQEMMPRDQFEKYMKALNDELRKIYQPALEISGISSENGYKLSMISPQTGARVNIPSF